MSLNLRWCLLLALVLTGAACNPESREYYSYYSPPASIWDSRTFVSYPIVFTQSPPTTRRLELMFRVDARTQTPQLQLEVELLRSGQCLRRDTLAVTLADSKGKWRQAGVVYHEYSVPLAHPLQIEHTGLYHLRLSRLDSMPLEGVASLGIHLK